MNYLKRKKPDELSEADELNRLYRALSIAQPMYRQAEVYLRGCLAIIAECKNIIKNKITGQRARAELANQSNEEE
jgi:hypothetical protein